MNDFDMTPVDHTDPTDHTDHTADALGDAYDPSYAPTYDDGLNGDSGGYADWMQSELVGYFDGVGSFEAIDFDMDGRIDYVAVDTDGDGSPDVIVSNNQDGTYFVEVDTNGDGVFDATTTVTSADLEAAVPELWSVVETYDSQHWTQYGDPGEDGDPGYGSYTVQPGDSLWHIAETQLGDPTRWPEIAELNPQIANPDLIYPGDELVLPAAAGDHSAPEPYDHGYHDGGDEGYSTYTVQPGDSLWHIAETQLGDPTRWPEIAALNPEVTDHPDLIFPGDELLLPPVHEGDDSGHHHGHHHDDGGDVYTVQPGDSMWHIAETQLGDPTRWPEIAELNPQIADPNVIHPGDKLVLPAAG